jgi:hypothetical protein
MLYKEIVRGNVIRKHIVKKYLDTVVIKWSEEMGDFREDYDVPCKIKFNDEEFDAIFVQGHDGSGSCGTEEQFLLNASKLLDGYWPENVSKHLGDNPMGLYRTTKIEKGDAMILSDLIRLATMVESCKDGEGKALHDKRVHAGNKLREIAEATGNSQRIRSMSDKMFFYRLLEEYVSVIKSCSSCELFSLRCNIEIDKIELMRKLLSNQEVNDTIADGYLSKSPDYSKKFKVVVSRDGNGSNADHYKLHGPLLPQDADDDCSIKKHFDDWEEFLTDEDGKRAEQNLRDVTVREVRLGKIVAKIEPVQEVVYKVVKK